ncbi:MAG: ABC transporter permease [Actinomycetota bacterium]
MVVAVVAISSMIGVAVGAISGFRGGLVDDLLMRATEAVQTVPRFFLAVVVVALFGPGLDRLILLLGLSSWPMLARVVRAQVLSLKQQEYVEAARLLGASDRRILLRDVLPNAAPTAVVVISLTAATVILLEAALARVHRPRRSPRDELGLSGQQRPTIPPGGVVDGDFSCCHDRACRPGAQPARRRPQRLPEPARDAW